MSNLWNALNKRNPMNFNGKLSPASQIQQIKPCAMTNSHSFLTGEKEHKWDLSLNWPPNLKKITYRLISSTQAHTCVGSIQGKGVRLNVWKSGFSLHQGWQSKGVLQTKPHNKFPHPIREFICSWAVQNIWRMNLWERLAQIDSCLWDNPILKRA